VQNRNLDDIYKHVVGSYTEIVESVIKNNGVLLLALLNRSFVLAMTERRNENSLARCAGMCYWISIFLHFEILSRYG